MSLSRGVGAAVAAVSIGLAGAPAAQAEHELPLRPPGLAETRPTDVLAPGLTYDRIVRGTLSPRDGWTVDVAIVPSPDELVARLRSAGFEA
jgi:hypothetical protein